MSSKSLQPNMFSVGDVVELKFTCIIDSVECVKYPSENQYYVKYNNDKLGPFKESNFIPKLVVKVPDFDSLRESGIDERILDSIEKTYLVFTHITTLNVAREVDGELKFISVPLLNKK